MLSGNGHDSRFRMKISSMALGEDLFLCDLVIYAQSEVAVVSQ